MSKNKANSLMVRTPAKVNLYLRVVGRRDDGYHDIESILVPISLFDVIRLEKTSGVIDLIYTKTGSVSTDSIAGEKMETNLAFRAAVELKAATGYSGGVVIGLEKNIPIGGGLGGGSADAAGVLIGLNELWGTGLSSAELIEIGAKLGCDVPALVHGGPVLMKGAGNLVSKVSIPPGEKSSWWLVLVNPGFGVSTGDIYSRYSLSLTSPPIPIKHIRSALKEADANLAVEGLFNALQETVFQKYPLIEMIAENLRKAGASGVLVSGSGASIFGIAHDEKNAREISGRVRQLPGYSIWSSVVRILPDGVMVAHGPLEARV